MKFISFPPKFGNLQVINDGDEVLIDDIHLSRLEENEKLRTELIRLRDIEGLVPIEEILSKIINLTEDLNS